MIKAKIDVFEPLVKIGLWILILRFPTTNGLPNPVY
jgi:hypothetical protein